MVVGIGRGKSAQRRRRQCLQRGAGPSQPWLSWFLGRAIPQAAPLAAEGTGEQEDTGDALVAPGRCRGPCFSPSAPQFLQQLQLGRCGDEARLGRVRLSGKCWGDVTRTLKVSYHRLTLARTLVAPEDGSGGGGTAAGLLMPGQVSVLALGISKDKIFSNPAALARFAHRSWLF